MNLRTKFITIIICILLFFGIATIFHVRAVMSETMLNEFQTRGISIARYVATESENHILTENMVELQHTIENTKKNEPEVVYIFIAAPDGKILSHTFKDGFPVDLLKANTLKQNNTENISVLNTAGGVIFDFAYPILQGKLGTVRVGISKEYISQIINNSILRETTLIIVVLFLGIITSFILANLITKPITKLRDATIEIGRGNLDIKIDVESGDELGHLASSFKKMAGDLKKSTVSKNYLNNIIESMFGSLIVTDSKGNINIVNKATCHLMEYTEEELIGQPVDIIFKKENTSNENSFFKEMIENDFITNVEKNYSKKNGEIIPMLFSSSIMRKERGDVIGIIFVAQELTEQKKNEEKIIKLNEDLQRQAIELTAVNKELEAFSYSVSHDLRAPLRSIDGFSLALMEDYSDRFDEEGKDYLRRVRSASQRPPHAPSSPPCCASSGRRR